MQILRDIKSCVVIAGAWYRHPHVRVQFGARILGKTRIEPEGTIGRGSWVIDSSLGRESRVDDGAWVQASRLGDGVAVHQGTRVYECEIDSYTYVAEQSYIAHASLGRFTSVGPYLICGYGTHPTRWVSTSPVFYSTRRQCGVSFVDADYFAESQRTTIGHDVWIGARVYLKDGIRVGTGAIVGAGAVVTADVADYAVVAGVPARFLRWRFDPDIVRRLLASQWWDWPLEKLLERQHLFRSEDPRRILCED